MLEYNEEIEITADIVRKILPKLVELKIPINPVNYALWYEYYIGRDKALIGKLDKIAAGQDNYSDYLADRLFAEHIGKDVNPIMDRLGDDVRLLLDTLIKTSQEAGESTNDYNEHLKKANESLNDVTDVSDLKALVNSLAHESEQMMQRNSKYHEQLKSNEEEIVRLRSDLAKFKLQARTDPLTGLANRSALAEKLSSAIDDAANEGTPVSLLMMDVDHFKKINDDYGHLVGDDVLRYLASVINSKIESKDLAVRFGGEEFALVMDETDAEKAVEFAEALRKTIAATKITHQKKQVRQFTVSLGISTAIGKVEPETLINAADMALYASKNNGRNQVTLGQVF